MANNAGTFRRVFNIAIQNLKVNNVRTRGCASGIAIHKSMVNNAGTFRCASDMLPSTSVVQQYLGRLGPVQTPLHSCAESN